MPLPLPPALQAPASKPAPPVPFPHAAIALLEAYDAGRGLPATPSLAPADRAAYQWLRACAQARPGHPPANPFPPGKLHGEAEALRTFWALPPDQALTRLPQLRTEALGTGLALWRWGKALTRKGGLPKAARQAWEDRLLDGPALDLVQGYALRHALCFALADRDEARLVALRSHIPADQEELYHLAQTAFGLLGNPLPKVRLWTLPGLRLEDHPLSDLGAPRLWMAPFEGTLPRVPPGCAWVVPTLGGMASPGDAQLDEVSTAEAGPVLKALEAAHRTAWLAPSRADFERLGLVHFPILLRFDPQGRLTELRMGDAAPEEPGF